MDITTIIGISGVISMVFIAVATGQVTAVFLNFHGIFLVCGGTFMSLLVNTPLTYFWGAIKEIRKIFAGQSWARPENVVPALITAAQNVHSQGINALRGVDQNIANGFFARAATLATEFNDPEFVRAVLENEVAQENEHRNELVNVFRTMGVLSPMFGLIGTLIGIVDVLKQITNPAMVGPAMAVAVTTAFYGILLANLFAVPLAGKIRLKHQQEYMMKGMIIEAIIEMQKGTVPAILERKLKTYITH
jgi:chemotaxis protein MotA